jgi:hypothetical protein
MLKNIYIKVSLKKSPPKMKPWPPAVRRKLRKAIYDFHVRAFGEEMARVNFLPLAKRRRYIAEMFDHATRKGVKFEKPALGVTP